VIFLLNFDRFVKPFVLNYADLLRLIGMTKCAREIKISEKYLAFFKETV
jgi:hypothetical protein